MTESNSMTKSKSKAFGKYTVYLIGESEGVKYWLAAPSWDCNWYWGFGYIQTFTNNNNPAKARDINTHTHADSSFVRSDDIVKTHGDNLFADGFFDKTTISKKEEWTLRELFATFYQLRRQADLAMRGSMHISNNPLKDMFKDQNEYKRINTVLIPAVMDEIITILDPDHVKGTFIPDFTENNSDN